MHICIYIQFANKGYIYIALYADFFKLSIKKRIKSNWIKSMFIDKRTAQVWV